MEEWEYLILEDKDMIIDENRMDTMGQEGWELVSVIAIQINNKDSVGSVRMYLKRKKD